MTKHLATFLFAMILSCTAIKVYGQSVDERIANAINSGAWRELRELYLTSGHELQTPFMHPLAKFFISHYYNQPDSAIHYGTILLHEHQQALGTSVSNLVVMMAKNLAYVGNYKAAAEMLHQLNEAMVGAGQEPPFKVQEQQYQMIADAGGFSVSKPSHDVKIPIRFYQDNRKDPVMMYAPVEINGVKEEVTYDTGAGANVISPETAEKVGARIYKIEGLSVYGVKEVATQFAIVDSLKLGEIVYRNVPFHVMDFATNNKEADEVMKSINLHCVIGIQAMLPLQEIQFDFANRYLIVPANPSPKPSFAPNMYSDGYKLILSIYDKKTKQEIDALVDTGSSTTDLSSRYYSRNQSIFEGIVPNDSVRVAGAGGTFVNQTIKYLWEYEIGDAKELCDSVHVDVPTTASDNKQYDCALGLPSLVPHDRVTINFKDMWLNLSPQTGKNRDVDAKVCKWISSKDWFTLDEKFPSLKDSIYHDHVRIMAEAILAHNFNRKMEAVELFSILINNYQEHIGGNTALSLATLALDNLERNGQHNTAQTKAKGIIDPIKANNLPIDCRDFEDRYARNLCLSQYDSTVLVRLEAKDNIVPFELKANRYYIPVKCHGKTYRFMFDTEASVTRLSPKVAKKLGAKQIGYSTPQGDYAYIDSLQVGNMLFKHVIAVIDNKSTDATIGMDVIQKANEIRIDNVKGQIVFPATLSPIPSCGRNMRNEGNSFYIKPEDMTANDIALSIAALKAKQKVVLNFKDMFMICE